jgi:DNA-binding NarL/FixJ family response regulator
MIKIAIVEDMIDIAEYFQMVLSKESDFEVVGVAHSGTEGVELVKRTVPDIVLMDIQMEHQYAGIDATEKIKGLFPEIKVIMLTVNEDDDMIYRAFAVGASEYIIKSASVADIINSIHLVQKNQLPLRPEIASKILDEFSRIKTYQDSLIYTLNIISKLTTAEFDVLYALNQGKSYRQIAEERFVEEVTIRTQVNKILKKFGEHNIKTVIKSLNNLKIFDIYKGQ